MSLVLKLSKCRLCLKLGDFYSIFAADNSIQLSKMAMACSEIKICEGDGLPDKICGECIEKLSSAYIFKQQCERSDTELRKSLLNNSGATEVSSYGRRNSDSSFSNRTDVATSKKEKASRAKAKKNDTSEERGNYSGAGGLLEESYSIDVPDMMSFEGPSQAPYNKHLAKSCDSGSNSPIISDPLRFECGKCDKSFLNSKLLNTHHCVSKDPLAGDDDDDGIISATESVTNKSQADHSDSNSKTKDLFDCNLCGKQFKFNIMLNRHLLTCTGPVVKPEEVPKRPTYATIPPGSLKCPVCHKVFKKRIYAMKHIRRSVCGEIALEFPDHPTVKVTKKEKPKVEKTSTAKSAFKAECSICTSRFSSHTLMFKHFQLCSKRRGSGPIACKTCNLTYTQMSSLYKHIKKVHYPVEHNKKKDKASFGLLTPKTEPVSADEGERDVEEGLKCRECDKTFTDQTQLVMHLAAHMANINEPKKKNKIDFNGTEYECQDCSKKFRYKGNLRVHLKTHHDYTAEDIMTMEGVLENFKCDLCDKSFQFEKSLKYHKSSKHSKAGSVQQQMSNIVPVSDKVPTEHINFTKCPGRCMHCNVMLRNLKELKLHNKMHISQNEKPKNEYTCPVCAVQFTNTKYFSVHIAEHNAQVMRSHEISSVPPMVVAGDGEDDDGEINVMDFCESVVANIKQEEPDVGTTTEGGYDGQKVLSDDGTPQMLVVNVGGFTCQICSKKLDTLRSYKYHMNWHTGKGRLSVKQVACPVCKQVFGFDSHLRAHMRQHAADAVADPTLLNCTECNKRTKNLRGFIAHMNWHKTFKDFRCPICLKQFNKRGHLAMHYRQHVKKNETTVIDCYDDEFTPSEQKVTDFQCSICKKYMPTEVSLRYHVRWHSSPAASSATRYECTKCNIAFTNKVRHLRHMRMHGDGIVTPFRCQICKRYLKSESQLVAHTRSHSFYNRIKPKKTKVACPICDQQFPHQLRLQRHIQRSHPQEKMVKKNDPGADDLPKIRYICKICGKEFPSDIKLKMHGERHERKPTFFICSLCGKRNISLKLHNVHIKGHLYQKFKDDPLKCDHCNETFTRRKEHQIHLYEVHNILETFTVKLDDRKNIEKLQECQCHICFKVLAKESTYLRHLDYHNSMRCNYCLKYFTSKTFLEAHINYDCDRKKVLGGSDPFEKRLKCTVCYKAFSVAIKLRCHMKVQHNIEPEILKSKQNILSICDFCFSAYPNEEVMLKHKMYHERFIKIYGCKFCPRKFSTMSLFLKHKKNHQNRYYTANPLKCPDCEEKFVYFNEYSSHLKETHNKEVDWIIPPSLSPVETCNICNKQFSHIHNHMMYHEKYRCKKCKDYFFSEILFDSHICPVESDDEAPPAPVVTHGNLKVVSYNAILEPYEECDFCFKAFTFNYTKQRHIVSHNKNVSFGCLYCEKTFTSLTSFSLHTPSHRLKHYKKNPLICKHCGEKFIKYGLYLKHLRGEHKENESMIIRPTFPPEDCKICKRTFSNIHYHYRFHLQFRCQSCLKYVLSEKAFKSHICNDPNEDKNLVLEFDEDITHLTIGNFDYNTLRHRPVDGTEDSFHFTLIKPKEYPLDDIDIIESELDDSVLRNVDISNMSYSPDISVSNQVYGSYPSNSHTPFGNFTPVISSTMSLSSTTPQTASNGNDSQDCESNIIDLDTDEEVSNTESAEELHKIVDDLENNYPVTENCEESVQEAKDD